MLVNRFIDWTKNIEAIECYRLSLYFDPARISFDQFKEQVFSCFDLVADYKLKNKLLSGQILYEKREVDGYYYANFDESEAYEDRYRSFGMARNIFTQNNIDKLTCGFQYLVPSLELAVALTKIPGLIIAILDNPYFTSWENAYQLIRYKYHGGLKNIHKSDYLGGMVHDISNRPGRYSNNIFFTFSGGSDYWFGSAFYKIIPKEKLLQIDFAKSIEELENDVIHVHLFDLKDYWLDDSREKLKQLRAYLKIDDLELPNERIKHMQMRPSIWSKIWRKFTE